MNNNLLILLALCLFLAIVTAETKVKRNHLKKKVSRHMKHKKLRHKRSPFDKVDDAAAWANFKDEEY